MQKVPHLEGLSSNYSKLLRVVYKGSLAHAEVLEDVSKDFVGGDLGAGDLCKLVEGKTKIFGKKVAGELVLHAVENALQAFVGTD